MWVEKKKKYGAANSCIAIVQIHIQRLWPRILPIDGEAEQLNLILDKSIGSHDSRIIDKNFKLDSID